MRIHQLFSRAALACALAFSLTACDSNDDDDDDDIDGGTEQSASSGTISGAASGSFSGKAYFVVDDGDFGFILFDGEPASLDASDEFLVIVRDNASVPGTGSYDIAADAGGSDFVAIYKGVGDPNALTTRIIIADTGSLDIDASGSERISGDYAFSGITATGTGETGSVQVRGDFDAIRVEGADFPEVLDTFRASLEVE